MDLTDAQFEELQADLRGLREQIGQTIRSTDEAAAVVDLDDPIGRLSRMDAMQQQQMAAAQKRRLELRLKQIGVALANEDYGYCKLCGEPIGYARLKARPESPCCVPCMATLEGS